MLLLSGICPLADMQVHIRTETVKTAYIIEQNFSHFSTLLTECDVFCKTRVLTSTCVCAVDTCTLHPVRKQRGVEYVTGCSWGKSCWDHRALGSALVPYSVWDECKMLLHWPLKPQTNLVDVSAKGCSLSLATEREFSWGFSGRNTLAPSFFLLGTKLFLFSASQAASILS